MNTKAGDIAIKKTDGTECQEMTETMKRWGEWAEECFRKKENQITPKIEHIQELEWGNGEMQVNEDLQLIRQQAVLTKIIQEEPETEHGSTKNMNNRTLAKN